MTDLGGSTTSPVAGGSSGQPPAGGVGAPTAASPNGGVGLLGWMRAGTLPIHPHVDDLTGGVIDYLRTQWGTDHLADTNPHPGYLTPAEGDLAYAPLDPGGGGYLTQTAGDTRYVNTTGDTMTGALTNQAYLRAPMLIAQDPASSTAAAYLFLHGAAGMPRRIDMTTAGSSRWALLTDPTAESGSNAGSDFHIDRHDDAGTLLGTALGISRATGAATFGGAVTTGGAVTANGALRSQTGAGTGGLEVEDVSGGAAPYWREYVYGTSLYWWTNAANIMSLSAAGALGVTGALSVAGNLGLFGTAATTKKTVTGSRAGNAALASLLTQLAAYGLITDSSTA